MVWNDLSDEARIWIYQADRPLRDTDILIIEPFLTNFIQQWNSHGNPLQGAYTVLHSRFVIIGIEESMGSASGCSIDTSLQCIKSISEATGIHFLNRMLVAYQNQDGEFVSEDFKKVKSLIQNQELNVNSLFANNTIQKKGELANKWLMPLKDSWLHK